MGKLPTYDSKVDLTTQPGVAQKSMDVAQQTGKNIQMAGKVVSGVQEVWQKAKDFSDTLKAKNQYSEEARKIEEEAKRDPDPDNDQTYRDRLKEARDKSLEGFNNNLARQAWQAEVDNLALQGNIKIDSEFWGKRIDKTVGDLNISREQNKMEYINTGDDHYIIEQKNNIEIAYLNGFISAKDRADRLNAIDTEWGKGRILKIAEDDYEGALWIVDNDNKMDAKEKATMKENIKTIHNQKRIKQEIEVADAEQKTVDDVRTIVKNDEYSYVAKLDAIQKSGLKDSDKKKMKEYLDSADRINATTYNDSIRETMSKIGELQSAVTRKSKKGDMLDYLKRIKEVRDYIIEQRTLGRLTQEDEDALNKEINEKIVPEEGYAMEKIRKNATWGWYSYNDAADDFDTLFNDNITNSNEAMREFYNRVIGKNYKQGELKQIANEVFYEVSARIRQRTVSELTGEESKALKGAMTDGDIMDHFNFSEADIEYNMKKHGVTRQQVIDNLRSKL